MGLRGFVFECSSNTYVDCVERGVFGSNVDWPLQVAQGDFCLLHHYDAGTVLGVWKAATNGGRKLVPRAWGGRYPFQAKVILISPEVVEIPKAVIDEFISHPVTGRFDHVIDGERAEGLIKALHVLVRLPDI